MMWISNPELHADYLNVCAELDAALDAEDLSAATRLNIQARQLAREVYSTMGRSSPPSFFKADGRPYRFPDVASDRGNAPRHAPGVVPPASGHSSSESPE